MKSKFYVHVTMVFSILLLFSFVSMSQTTLEIKISDVNDDAEEVLVQFKDHRPVGYVDLVSSDLELCWDREPQLVGLIFRDVQIPTGATVTSAYVQFQVDAIVEGTTDADLTLEIYGGAEANTSAPFLTDTFNISSRPATTAKVEWKLPSSAAVGDRGENERTPDLSEIINEIISLDGWVAGNNIMIAIADDVTRTEDINREMEAFDGDEEGAPMLVVVFEGGSTGINTIAAELSSSIYPNPAVREVYIENPSANKFSYKIYDLSGKIVAKKFDISGSKTEVDVSGFKQGLYFVDVVSNKIKQTHKLIVE